MAHALATNEFHFQNEICQKKREKKTIKINVNVEIHWNLFDIHAASNVIQIKI